MITWFIIFSVFAALSLLLFYLELKERKWALAGLMLFCVALNVWNIVDLNNVRKRGNRQTVTYSFPAETYRLDVMVTEGFTVTEMNGVRDTVTRRDTTYVLTGEEPVHKRFKDARDVKTKTRTVKPK